MKVITILPKATNIIIDIKEDNPLNNFSFFWKKFTIGSIMIEIIHPKMKGIKYTSALAAAK
jgi:hypothetical protein